ncbi:MAG: FlgD immunoglobulin-like domain containing protein [bacterium]
MKKFFLFLLLISLSPGISFSQNLLSGPQKIVIDSKRNRLIVSNYNTGDIVQIDSAGNQTYFLQNAGFVDGLEIVGDTVYGVGNDRIIRGYNLATRQIVMTVTFSGSSSNYLSSITYDSAGHLLISCPSLNEIYKLRISDHSYWLFVKNSGLNKPNGILLERDKNRIVVIDDSPSPSLIHAISLTDSSVTSLLSTTLNRPDGIVRDKYGYYYIGGYYLPGIYQTDPGFSQPPELFFAGTTMVYPTYDPENHALLITHYNANTWERVPLTSTGMAPSKQSQEFILYPIIPNPFRSQAMVRFELKNRFYARMDVYDTVGNLVKTLLNEVKDPGTYTKAWDGRNISGKQVAGGLFYFRMNVNGSVQTQKAVLVR